MYLNIQYSLFFLSLLLFSFENEQSNIKYLYDSDATYDITTVRSSPSFLVINEDINNGLENGIYWFKMLPESVSNKKIIIENSHILKAKVYVKNEIILPLEKESYITFNIPEVHTPVFLKVDIEREAYIPIRIEKENVFLSQKFKGSFFNGIYYGFTLMLFIINIFYFFHFKEITFYLYVVALFFISISLAFSDGTFNYVFSHANWLKNVELINQYLLAVSGFYFAYNFLELDFYIPKTKVISIVVLLLLLPVVIAYLVFDLFFLYIISEILVFGILGMYLFCGFKLYKKSKHAKFFCLAYSLIFLLGIDYYIARNLGINVTDFKPVYFKIGGVVEMLLISYAIVYRMNILKKENELMREAIFEYLQKIDHLKKEKVEDIIAVNENEFSLQEVEIIKAINNDLSNKEIAEKMSISISTVKYHTKKIYNKLQIESRKEIQTKTVQLV